MAGLSNVSSARENLAVWVLTDGKIGDDVQCLAVARALCANFEKRVIRPRPPWSWLVQYGVIDPRDRQTMQESPIAGTPPDIVVASGRRSIGYAAAVKRASGGKTKIVFLKDPRINRAIADIIWAPSHDRLQAPNAFSTLTSPHGLSPKIADHRAALAEKGLIKKPALGVILGGGAGYSRKAAAALAASLVEASADYRTVSVTPSRRTPLAFMDVLRRALHDAKYSVWNGVGDNPYIDILAQADTLVVAADSHNMMSEALASGAGVYAWRPPRLVRKLDWFVKELERKGAVRPFKGAAPVFTHPPIDATSEITEAVQEAMA